MAKISPRVNSKSQIVDVDPEMPLLYALRNDLALNGPKFGCGLAQCGACTVIMDGSAIRAGGEPSSAPIGNAIFDATGVRLREAPFTPARLLAGLKKV